MWLGVSCGVVARLLNGWRSVRCASSRFACSYSRVLTRSVVLVAVHGQLMAVCALVLLPVHLRGACHVFSTPCSCAAVKARGTDLRVHYKQTREIAAAVHGMNLKKAIAYLRDVVEFKRIIPFRVHTGGIGRHAQARSGGRLWGHGRGRTGLICMLAPWVVSCTPSGISSW